MLRHSCLTHMVLVFPANVFYKPVPSKFQLFNSLMFIPYLYFSGTLVITILGAVIKEICREMKVLYWNNYNRHGHLAVPKAIEGVSTLQAGYSTFADTFAPRVGRVTHETSGAGCCMSFCQKLCFPGRKIQPNWHCSPLSRAVQPVVRVCFLQL